MSLNVPSCPENYWGLLEGLIVWRAEGEDLTPHGEPLGRVGHSTGRQLL